MYTRYDTPFGINPGVKKGETSAQHTSTIGIYGRKSLVTSDRWIVLTCTPEGSKREKHTNLHTFEDPEVHGGPSPMGFHRCEPGGPTHAAAHRCTVDQHSEAGRMLVHPGKLGGVYPGSMAAG